MAARDRDRVSLVPDDVHVWYRPTESLSDAALTEARASLSHEEQSRHDRYRLASDRRDYAVAHALLRTSLSRYSDVDPHAWAFKAGAHRKPELAPRPGQSGGPAFNLSHARGMVACALASGGDVGIDVERTDITFDYSSIASRCLAPDEVAQIERCPEEDRSARFIDIWTLKEAYVKATGRGLSEMLSDSCFTIRGEQIHFTPPPNACAEAWQFVLYALEPHHRIAVAICRRDAPTCKISAWPADDLEEQSPSLERSTEMARGGQRLPLTER